MSSAFSDNSVTNNGLIGISSASQLGNNNVSVGNSAQQSYEFERDARSKAPSWLDWITGYDRNFDNARYQQWLSDTAIQRRVADAKLAGVNPLFAIGPNSAAESNVSFGKDTQNEGFGNLVKAGINIIGLIKFLSLLAL